MKSFKYGQEVGIVGKFNKFYGYKGKIVGAYGMLGDTVYVVKFSNGETIDCLAPELVVVNKGGVAK